MAVTVEELEIVIEAKIQEALNGLETVQKKLMETATKVAPQFNKQMQAAMSGLASNLVQPIEKAQQQMKSAMEQTQAVTKKQSDAIIQQQKDIASQIQHTTKELKKQSQAISKAVSVENNVEKPLKVPETPASKTGNDNQRHLYDMTHAAGAVADSVGRTFQLMEGMKQASGEVAGIVANNLENVSKKIQTQGALLTQLQQKFAQTVNSNGISPKALQAQMKILNAEDDMRKLVEQYNKIIERAEKTADVVKRTAQTMGDSYDMLIEKDAKRQEQMFKGSGYDRFPDEPAKPSKLASQILRDDTTADSAAQAQAAAMQRASQAVQQSIDRVQKALESMRQVSAQATGAVAANLENINQKMQAQQALLDQLQEKLARAMASEGMSEKTVRVQKQLLGAESAMRKLVDQYNKAAESAEEAADSTEEIKDKAGGVERSAKKLPNPFLQAAKATKSIKSGMEKATASTKKFQQTAKTVTTKVEGFFQKLGRAIMAALPFLALAQAFRKFSSFIGEGIKSAINAPEIENMFAVALGNMAAEADAFAKQFKKSLGVDEYATKQMIGTFNNMIATMGIGRKTAYNMSRSLTILANDMASLYNVAPEQAFENLQSAMSGQSEAVRKYGYILNETTIKQVALRHGIIQEGQTLNENQKVLARYLALMEQSTAAQGDMARTIGSLQNQLRILKGNIAAAGRAIGEAFIPFLEAVIPWLNAFAIVLQRLGTSLARFTYSLFGRDYDAEKKKQQDAIKDAANITGGLEDVADAEKDVGKEADKTKKKVQNMLAPFDELYVIQQKTDEEKTPENPNVPNLEWDVPTLEVPDGESPLEQLADRIMDKLRDIFKVFRQAWENEGQNTIDAAKYAFGSLLEAIKAVGRSFSEVWNNGTGQEFVENILRLVQTILNIIGDIASAFTIAWEKAGAGTALIQQIFDAVNAVLELVISIGKAFREAWNDGRGVEIWDAILSIATNVFAIVENLADRLRTAWEQNDNGVKIWGHILDIVQDVLDFIDRITEATANWAAQLDFGPLVGSFENLLGVIEQLVDSILNGLGWAYENVLLPFGTWLIQTAAPAFLDAVAAVLGSSVWKDAARSIKDLYENSLKPLAKWAADKLMDFLNWIKSNGDAAAKIIITIGKGFLIWKSIKFANNIATDFLNMVKTIKNSGLVKVIDGIKNAFMKMSGSASTETGKVSTSFKGMASNVSTSLSGLVSTVTTKIKGVATAIATFAATNPFGAVAIAVGVVATAIGVTLYGEYKKTIDMMEERNMAKAFDGVPVSLDAVKASMEGIVQKYSELDQKVQEHKVAMQSLQTEYSTTISSIETSFDVLKNGTADVGTAMDNLGNGLMGLSSNIKSQVDTDGTYFYNTWKGIFDNTEVLTEEREAEILQNIVSSNETRKNEVDRIEGELQNLLAQWREAQIKGEQDKAAQIEQEVRRHYDELAKIAEQEQARQAEVDKQRQMLLAREILEGRQIVTKENYQELLAQIDQDEKTARDSAIGFQSEVRANLEANHKSRMQELQNEGATQAEIDEEVKQYTDALSALNANYAKSLEEIGAEAVTSKTLLQQAFTDTAQDAKNVQDEFQGIQDKISSLNSYIEGQNRLFGTEFFDIDGINSAQTELETLQTKLQALVEANPEMFAKRWDGQFTFIATEAAEATREIQNAIQTSIEESARYASTEGGAISKNLFDGLKSGVNERLEEIRGTMGSVADAMITRFNEDFQIHSPSQVMYEKGLYITQGLAQGITDNLKLVSDAINQLAETIKTALQQTLSLGAGSENSGNNTFYQYGSQIVQGLAQGISENTQILTDTLNQTAEAINTSFKELFQIEDYSMVFYNYGMGFMQGLAQGVTEGIEIVREAFLAVGEAINTALNEALAVLGGGEMGEESSQGQNAGSGNGNVFYQFGAKLMMGLSQGITDTLPVVLETITVISTSIIDAFKQAFLIDEFSQVFFDFGVLLMQSLADGITEGMALVQEQMEALAELITQLYTDFIAEFSETLSNDLESINQIVSDQMDEMVNIVSEAVDEAAKKISSLISKINSAISKARELQSIASSVGGYSSGRNARRSVSYAADIPQFASGAVLRSPTVGLMAEYAGAASNPEIVTPQNILQEIMIESMSPAVSALSAKLDVLIEAVRQGKVEIKGDAAEFLHVMKKADEGNSIMTGQSIFAPF